MLILGAARQGTALARFLLGRGASIVLNDRQPTEALGAAQQSLSDLVADRQPLIFAFGGHPVELLDGVDLLCVSGGVPLDNPLVEQAIQRGIPLSNDSQIFMQVVPCKVAGITGSAGKTTTTTLVGRMAQAAHADDPSCRVWVGGNIGSPLITNVDVMQVDDLAVVEFSSFQLELMTISPQVAAVLNITPNHLDRHGDMAAYIAAKSRILQFQSPDNVAILGRDDLHAWSMRSMVNGRSLSFGISKLPDGEQGVYLEPSSKTIRLRMGDASSEDQLLMRRDQIRLRGEHNLLNVMAACTIAAALGLPEEAMRAGVEGFTGVPHRLEFVRHWGGADWYNDSIATAPERAMADIRSFNEPLVLLVGGRDKKLPWEEFVDLARERARHLILFGEAADQIAQVCEKQFAAHSQIPPVTRCGGLQEAVQVAAQVVRTGDVVLLSPGGTSFDEFKDFEERGKCFVNWVKNLP